MTPSPFPRGYRSTPIPNPLLADLLVEITDPDELRLTLRAVWALHQQRAFPPSVTMSDLASDRTVAAMLETAGKELESRVSALLDQAAERGTLLKIAERGGPDRYFLNTEPVRRVLARQGVGPGETREAVEEGSRSRDLAGPRSGRGAVVSSHGIRGKHRAHHADGRRKDQRRDRRLHGVGGHRGYSGGGGEGRTELELCSGFVATAAKGAG